LKSRIAERTNQDVALGQLELAQKPAPDDAVEKAGGRPWARGPRSRPAARLIVAEPTTSDRERGHDRQRMRSPPVKPRQGGGLRRKYGVNSLAVFGSMARGDDRDDSDVDILATFEGQATFDNFRGLKLDLEDLLGRRVDLGMPSTLRPEMWAEVEKELIHVP
jgi:predicted nucleotidyltransferase